MVKDSLIEYADVLSRAKADLKELLGQLVGKDGKLQKDQFYMKLSGISAGVDSILTDLNVRHGIEVKGIEYKCFSAEYAAGLKALDENLPPELKNNVKISALRNLLSIETISNSERLKASSALCQFLEREWEKNGDQQDPRFAGTVIEARDLQKLIYHNKEYSPAFINELKKIRDYQLSGYRAGGDPIDVDQDVTSKLHKYGWEMDDFHAYLEVEKYKGRGAAPDAHQLRDEMPDFESDRDNYPPGFDPDMYDL